MQFTTSIMPATKAMTFFLLIPSILFAIARGITKAVIVRSTSPDEHMIALSLVSTTRNLHWETQSGHITYTPSQFRFSALGSQLPCSSRPRMATRCIQNIEPVIAAVRTQGLPYTISRASVLDLTKPSLSMRLHCYTSQAYFLQSLQFWPLLETSHLIDGTVELHIQL